MNIPSIKLAILHRLADEWDRKGPPGRINFRALSEELGVPEDQFFNIIHSLLMMGCVDTDASSHHIDLTAFGYAQARPNDPSVRGDSGNVLLINAPVSGTSIAIDHSTSHVTITPEELLLGLIEQVRSHPQIPEEKKKKWLPILQELSRVPAVLESLRNLLGSLC